MPLEVKTRILKRSQVKRGSLSVTFDAPYTCIHQQGYGRMDVSTPGKGLATDGVASCTVVIFHCPETKRTTVSHSPNFLNQWTFLPMINWVTGGSERTEMREDEAYAFFVGEDMAFPTTLEVVVLRGYMYGTPHAATFGHDEWMEAFRSLFSMFIEARRITLNLYDSPRLLKNGVVLVDRETATITHVELAPGISAPLAGLRLAEYASYGQPQYTQDLFMSNLHMTRRNPQRPPIRLQYDINSLCLPTPLNDEARQLVRSVCLKQPSSAQSAILREFNLSHDWAAPGYVSPLGVSLSQLLKHTA